MFIAKDIKSNIDTPIETAVNERSEYVCPLCGAPVIIKNGNFVASHFAHTSGSQCDTFSQDMSKWHRDWQNIFPKKNQEHVLTATVKESDYMVAANHCDFESRLDAKRKRRLHDEDFWLSVLEDTSEITISHRADVCACGYVIEFQHSPLSCAEFAERNWFYNEICGKKVIWVFDADNWDIFVNRKKENHISWKWNHAIKTFSFFLPQYYIKQKDEEGKWQDSSILLFFHIVGFANEEIVSELHQVTWAPEDEYGNACFKYFNTSKKHVYTKESFKEAIIQRKL